MSNFFFISRHILKNMLEHFNIFCSSTTLRKIDLVFYLNYSKLVLSNVNEDEMITSDLI